MRSIIVAVVIVFSALPALADPETQVIGRITETATHKPIQGAVVTVRHGDTELQVLTDANGLYRLLLPEAGTYQVAYVYADVKGQGSVDVATGTFATLDGSLDVDSESVIFIHEPKPVIAPKMVKDARRKIAPEYSDAAIERDAWTRAWLLLDIDARGTVTRVKLLNAPGYDLEPIAVKQAFKTKFEPARDGSGNPVRSLLVWTIEWPSYWWMVMFEGVATRIPDDYNLDHVPCRGSGPLHLSSLHPSYRDCAKPNLSRVGSAKWVNHP